MAARGWGCVWSEFVARSEIINLIRRRSRLPFSSLLLTIEVRRRREERETKTKEKSYFHSNATLLISGVSFGAHLYIVYSQVLGQCTHARSEQRIGNTQSRRAAFYFQPMGSTARQPRLAQWRGASTSWHHRLRCSHSLCIHHVHLKLVCEACARGLTHILPNRCVEASCTFTLEKKS